MQLYALDKNNRLIAAPQADKQKDYFCLECNSAVRRRGGSHRHVHFYHLLSERPCRQSRKGIVHLHLQWHLLQLLPAGEAFIEKRFAEVNRIADVAWLPKRIVFEVQCAPITAEEILARNADYTKVGFLPIWILHESRYNRYRLSAAEFVLREQGYRFFTNMDSLGCGVIYDQFDICRGGKRVARLPTLPVNLSCFQRGDFGGRLVGLRERQKGVRISFEGDFVHKCLAEPEDEYVRLARERVNALQPKPLSWWEQVCDVFYGWVVRPYRLLLVMLIERSCKR